MLPMKMPSVPELGVIPTWLAVVVPTAGIIYLYLKSSKRLWVKKGVPGPPPTIIFGNLMSLGSMGIHNFCKDVKQKYGNKAGLYIFGQPTLVVHDLDMLQEICVKQFDKFTNHTINMAQYPVDKMLTVIEDDHWRHVRHCLLPTFTGAKLRNMNKALNECCKVWISQLIEKEKSGEIIEFTDEGQHLTGKLIARLGFGLDLGADKEIEETFFKSANHIVQQSTSFNFTSFLYLLFPRLMLRLGVPFYDSKVIDFYKTAVDQTIDARRDLDDENATDFLQTVVKMDKGYVKESDMQNNPDLVKTPRGHIYSKSGLTRDEILGSSMFFFLAGYDTVGKTTAFLCYNLACNQDIQDRVYAEIQEVMADKDELDYDDIKKMTYLQMCVEESMRMFPPALATDRKSGCDVEINGIKLDKGTSIMIPIMSIHRDPDIYPDPDTFNPERFTAEAKAARHPMAYLPFGQGPRMCIGNRLALMEVKFPIIHLLKKFRLVTCNETQIPIVLEKMKLAAEKGVQIKLMLR